ncbi:tRNA 2-thiouridine(34) synthase MnmA [bacterium]|nr:tRNA 2-thiouridine(34) synthase MnmA [bacterium]
MSKGRVMVAMSGGVDSSVAALMLTRAGYECIGMTAILFGDASAAGPCCGTEGANSAECVCNKLGIEFRHIDLSELFEEQVIGRFLGEYDAGRTPNPCSDCNRFIKFDTFFKYADEWGCDYVATGHYARIIEDGSARLLGTGIDNNKDQSYFLACIPPHRLKRVLFPLGGIDKPEVRRLAREAMLPTAHRTESQDVCFMHNGAGIDELMSWHMGKAPEPGEVVDEAGNVLSTHKGYQRYTVGQRRGMRLGGGTEGLVVHRVEPETNRVVVAMKDAHPLDYVGLRDFVDMAPGRWQLGQDIQVRMRYRQPLFKARVLEHEGQLRVYPLERQYGAALGQWCVGYDGDVVLFGGIIDGVEYET